MQEYFYGDIQASSLRGADYYNRGKFPLPLFLSYALMNCFRRLYSTESLDQVLQNSYVTVLINGV